MNILHKVKRFPLLLGGRDPGPLLASRSLRERISGCRAGAVSRLGTYPDSVPFDPLVLRRPASKRRMDGPSTTTTGVAGPPRAPSPACAVTAGARSSSSSTPGRPTGGRPTGRGPNRRPRVSPTARVYGASPSHGSPSPPCAVTSTTVTPVDPGPLPG